jgi:hypothetical protein
MSYLQNYLHFTGGTECPRPYRIWSALSLLGSILGRKVWVNHGRFQILPSLYVCLVGDAGSGKSTAKNDAKKLLTHTFPDYPTSASFQSHQDIIDLMCNAQPTVWEERLENEEIKIHGYTPFYIICNEFSSLLSTDKKGMVEFLVDIYDENEFSTGFKGQRMLNPEKKQRLDNPFVSVLACAVPKWFMGNLKLDLFDGGLGRRLVIVYCQKNEVVPNPIIDKSQEGSRAAVVEHLKEAVKVQGEIVRTPEAMKWWETNYRTWRSKVIDDPILAQFYQTRPVHVLKVATGLAMCERPFKMVIEPDHLDAASKLFEGLEPDILRLTAGIGRNELAGVGAQLIDFLTRMGGAAGEVHLKKHFNRYLQTREFQEVQQHYLDTQELFILNIEWEGMRRNVYMLPDYHENFMAKREMQLRAAAASALGLSASSGPLPANVPALAGGPVEPAPSSQSSSSH